MVYESFSWKADCIATSNTADVVLLPAYDHMHLLDPAADPTCPLCKEEQQTLEHWQQWFPNFDVLRQHTFGSPSLQIGVLTTDLELVLAIAKATFKSHSRPPQQQQERHPPKDSVQFIYWRRRKGLSELT